MPPKQVYPERQQAQVENSHPAPDVVDSPEELRSLCAESYERNEKLQLNWNRYELVEGEEDNHQLEEDVAEVNAGESRIVDSVGLTVNLPQDGIAEDAEPAEGSQP